eukprot:7908513-Pyramimonas_sp.AAC.1
MRWNLPRRRSRGLGPSLHLKKPSVASKLAGAIGCDGAPSTALLHCALSRNLLFLGTPAPLQLASPARFRRRWRFWRGSGLG